MTGDEVNPPATKPGMLPPRGLMIAVALVFLAWAVDPVDAALGFPLLLVGLVPIALGLDLNLAADRAFIGAETTVKPFEQTTALVTDGVLAYSRNPMYLGMVLVLVGIWIMVGGVLPGLVVLSFAWWIDRRFIRLEEAKLHRQIGPPYAEYCSRVGRWVSVPGV